MKINAVGISPQYIRNMAEIMINDVDVHDYESDGYTLKDIEIAIDAALGKLIEQFVNGSIIPEMRRVCDVDGCTHTTLLNDIFCAYHRKKEDGLLPVRNAEDEELPF